MTGVGVAAMLFAIVFLGLMVTFLSKLPALTRAGDGRDSSPVPRPSLGGSPPEHSSSSVRAPEHARPGS